MQLNEQELAIIRQALPLIKKLISQPEENILYAVGNCDEEGNWGFQYGPDMDLHECVTFWPELISTKHSAFYVVELNPNGAPKKLYKWFPDENKWKKLKQK